MAQQNLMSKVQAPYIETSLHPVNTPGGFSSMQRGNDPILIALP